MSGTNSPASEKPWQALVADIIAETVAECIEYGEIVPGCASEAAARIAKLNAPIDPQASLLGTEPGRDLLVLMVAELKRRLQTPSVVQQMAASEMEMIRKLLSDNSVTLAAIRRGDFGEIAQRASEEYPFPEGNRTSVQ